jgi:tRNA U34 5-carboxymethylaminomethyl modifying enzyme MnmG/GidA
VLMEADGRTSGEDWGVRAEKVIVTTGTFLRGLIHVGKETTPAGGRHFLGADTCVWSL